MKYMQKLDSVLVYNDNKYLDIDPNYFLERNLFLTSDNKPMKR